jgi:hypothetical protein
MELSRDEWARDLEIALAAGAPLIWVESDEEQRPLAVIERCCARAGRPVTLWSCARGLHALRAPPTVDARTQDPLVALDAHARAEGSTALVLFDLHPFLSQALLVRRVREARAVLAAHGKTLIFLSPMSCPSPELRAEMDACVVPPPGPEELGGALRAACSDDGASVSSIEQERLVSAARGLRSDAFALALRRARARFGAIDARALAEVRRAQSLALRDGALLELVSSDEGLASVGGLDALKRWVDLRARAFSTEARAAGVDAPRGLFLLGVQGGGKSSCARSIAGRWGLPLLRLDVGRLFHGVVGASEANVRRALAQAEAAAPCVLWLDEVARGFSGLQGGGDSGIGARVFGALLSWLQDRAAPVFVVATANDVSATPPELLRKGRFDEVFFVDLPTRIERAEIARIHLARRRPDAMDLDLDAFAGAAEGFSGAEIEQCVVAALLYAFDEGRGVSQGDLHRAARETVPLSRSARESLEGIRRWASGRARPASTLRDGVDTRVAL